MAAFFSILFCLLWTSVTSRNFGESCASTACNETNTVCELPANNCSCNPRATREADKCIFQAELGEVCQTSDYVACKDTNAKCTYDGSNTNTLRCVCGNGYIKVDHDDQTQCALLVSVEACVTCLENEGKCYSVSGPGNMDGCSCPASRTGDNCMIIHVNVSCSADPFSMTICYTPHSRFEFTNDTETSAVMRVLGQDSDPACWGQQDPSFCPDNTVGLVIPLVPDGQCGTELHAIGSHMKKYQAMIEVKDSPEAITGQLVFKTYCSFQTKSDVQAGTQFSSANLNDRGQHIDANLELFILDIYDDIIPEDRPLTTTDRFKMLVILNRDEGHYAAMRVESCLASDKPNLGDPKAKYQQLIINGCPVTGQTVITDTNNFKKISATEARTEELPAFRIPGSFVLYLHCKVKLCLTGEETQCDPYTCGDNNGTDTTPAVTTPTPAAQELTTQADDVTTAAPSRKKRSTDEEEDATISRKLIVFDENAQSLKDDEVAIDKFSFAAIIAIMIVMILVCVAIMALLYYRLRRGKTTKEDEIQFANKPQRFALPRNEISHVRM